MGDKEDRVAFAAKCLGAAVRGSYNTVSRRVYALVARPRRRNGIAMLLKMLRAKIHRATITEACVDYVGSITIDRDLLEAASMLPGECVLVADLTDGQRFETYVMEGPAGSGVICINGAAARLVDEGDKIIIMAYGYVESDEAKTLRPKVVLVNEQNRITEVR